VIPIDALQRQAVTVGADADDEEGIEVEDE
jgi:hypothetical protein